MKTVILSQTEIDRIASFLLEDQIVCLPTETVFGLAIVADNYDNYMRLVECKNRPINKAFPLLIHHEEQLHHYAEVSARTNRLVQRFLPGPLTLVLPKKQGIPDYVTAHLPQIAIRWSEDPFLQAVARRVKKPLFLTSANLSNEPTCRSVKEAYEVFAGRVACIVEGQPKSQMASTIVDVSQRELKLLRQGEIPFQLIKEVGGTHMKIALGSDHAGFEIKEAIKTHLQTNLDYEVMDLGAYSCDSVDYPSFGIAVGEKVANKEADFGIAICGSGIGISIAANKVKGIRCALVTNEKVAQLSRQHNDANVIALPGRFVTQEEAISWVELFLTTPFEGGRHQRRIDLLLDYENKK